MGPPEIILRSFRNAKRFSKLWTNLRSNRFMVICVRLTLIKDCVTCPCLVCFRFFWYHKITNLYCFHYIPCYLSIIIIGDLSKFWLFKARHVRGDFLFSVLHSDVGHHTARFSESKSKPLHHHNRKTTLRLRCILEKF